MVFTLCRDGMFFMVASSFNFSKFSFGDAWPMWWPLLDVRNAKSFGCKSCWMLWMHLMMCDQCGCNRSGTLTSPLQSCERKMCVQCDTSLIHSVLSVLHVVFVLLWCNLDVLTAWRPCVKFKKSSCLLICFHSWSLDLSQTLIQTIQILKEAKTGPKPWKNQKKNKRNKKKHPMSPVQLLLRPFHGSKLFFCFFLVLSSFLPPWPKNAPKPMEKQKTQKTKKFHPMSPVQLLLRPSPWVETVCVFFCFLFFLVFWRFLQLCQSNNINSHFFVFFVFVFLGLLGEIFTLTNIHWHSFHPSTFYIEFFIELLILATEPSEKMYSKNSFITHLFRHSIGLMFYWYAEVLVPYI